LDYGLWAKDYFSGLLVLAFYTLYMEYGCGGNMKENKPVKKISER
jgi:hypothetical protein